MYSKKPVLGLANVTRFIIGHKKINKSKFVSLILRRISRFQMFLPSEFMFLHSATIKRLMKHLISRKRYNAIILLLIILLLSYI